MLTYTTARTFAADLSDRIARGHVVFAIEAILAEPGDDLASDITLRWTNEDGRIPIRLGTIAVTAVAPDAVCDADVFQPGRLADGLDAPRDPIFATRSAAYAISFGQRAP